MNNLLKLNQKAAATMAAAASATASAVANKTAKTTSLAVAETIDTQRKPLEDLFGRNHNYLRVSLTERCNLRCNSI